MRGIIMKENISKDPSPADRHVNALENQGSEDLLASRRDFLRKLALGAAGLAVGSCIRAQQKADGQQGRKLGIALLGLGGYSTYELGPALRQTNLCSLTGVVTGTPEKAERWAANYQLDRKN